MVNLANKIEYLEKIIFFKKCHFFQKIFNFFNKFEIFCQNEKPHSIRNLNEKNYVPVVAEEHVEERQQVSEVGYRCGCSCSGSSWHSFEPSSSSSWQPLAASVAIVVVSTFV